jgi:hypothetical protein
MTVVVRTWLVSRSPGRGNGRLILFLRGWNGEEQNRARKRVLRHSAAWRLGGASL